MRGGSGTGSLPVAALVPAEHPAPRWSAGGLPTGTAALLRPPSPAPRPSPHCTFTNRRVLITKAVGSSLVT